MNNAELFETNKKENQINEENNKQENIKSFNDKQEQSKYHESYDKYEEMIKLKEKEEANIENEVVANYDKAVKDAILVKEKARETKTALSIGRDVVNSKAFKAAFLSLMLLSKAGSVSAENYKSDKEENKTEIGIKSENKKEKKNDTYVATYEEFAEKVKLEATNYFETDKAEIGLENQEKLEKDFHKFLNTINKDNFKDLIDKEWTVKGSSDERETNNWEGSNENLTIARIEAVKSVVVKSISNHDFSNELEDGQIEEIKSKEIKIKYPKHSEENKEDGVTYLNNLINSETKKHYTEAEISKIKENDPKAYSEMLESCRFTNFEIESNFFELEKFDRVHFLIDESGSMQASKSFISQRLKEVEYNKPVNLHTYSDVLNNNEVIKCENSIEASERILEGNKEGSFRERQFDATLALVNKIIKERKENPSNFKKEKIYLATDEALQSFSLKELELLDKYTKNNEIDIELLISYNTKDQTYMLEQGEQVVIKIGLDGLLSNVQEKANDKLEKMNNYSEDKDRYPSNIKIDKYYQKDYQEKASSFETSVKNWRNDPFFNALKSRGYGETPTEIRKNIEKEFSGAGNYKKVNELVNGMVKGKFSDAGDIRQLINSTAMGGRPQDQRHFADAVKNVARPLRELIEAKNKFDVVSEACENMDENDIPTMDGDVFFKSFNSFSGNENDYKVPVKGPTDLLSSLEY